MMVVDGWVSGCILAPSKGGGYKGGGGPKRVVRVISQTGGGGTRGYNHNGGGRQSPARRSASFCARRFSASVNISSISSSSSKPTSFVGIAARAYFPEAPHSCASDPTRPNTKLERSCRISWPVSCHVMSRVERVMI